MDQHRSIRVKAVVDTNVIAYLLLNTPDFADETTVFWKRAANLLAPALWEAEITNVIWLAAREGVIAKVEAGRRLRQAAQLGVRSVPSRSLWQGALVRAMHSDVSVYDTLFVELAAREGIPLATYDRRLLEAYPELASRPGNLSRSD